MSSRVSLLKSRLRARFREMSFFTACSTTHNPTVRSFAAKLLVHFKRWVLLMLSNQFTKIESQWRYLERSNLLRRRGRTDRSQGPLYPPHGRQLPARYGPMQYLSGSQEISLAAFCQTRHRSDPETCIADGISRGLFAILLHCVHSSDKTTDESTNYISKSLIMSEGSLT